MKHILILSAAACLLGGSAAGAHLNGTALQEPELIPRDVFFGNPDHAAVRISPDGKHLSWSAPVDGVMNLWVAPVGSPRDGKPITADKGRGITQYFWAYDNQHILYLQDTGGNENFNLYKVDLKSGKSAPLHENNDVRAEVQGVSEKKPGSILVALNERVPMFHDVYEMDIATGEKKLVVQHPGTIQNNVVAGFVTDDEYNVRFASAFANDGGIVIYEHAGKQGPEGRQPAAPQAQGLTPPGQQAMGGQDDQWKEWRKVDFEDTLGSNILGFGKDANTVYLADSKDRDTAALYKLDLSTGKQELLAEDDKADIGGAIIHPTDKTVQAVAFNYEKNDWKVLDNRIAADVAKLDELAGEGEWGVTSRTLDDSKWVIALSTSDGPVRYYLYERNPGATSARGGKETYLFSNNSRIEALAQEGALQPMHPVVIPARDELALVSYLTLPAGVETKQASGVSVPVPEQAVPMVLLVHGGPWGRDAFGYNAMHQWLANRGYAVLSVNFRGSTGFGKNHVNAGNLEWGKKMQDDLTDAVAWAVENGIAQTDKVAIMGGSYGGYATLAGLTMTPDIYAAGVDIVGPSNIMTLLATIPPYWEPAKKMFYTRVGDPTTEEGKALLTEASPLTHVDNIRAPLLIGQGANDPRVKQSESDQIVQAMKAKNIPVTYVLYPDEGHGFMRPPNRMSFFGVSEAFLAEHLGGRYQPLSEDDFEGSSIQVPEGAAKVPGLETVLPKN